MADEHDDRERADTVDRMELARIAFVTLAAAAVWFRVWEPSARVSVIGVVGTMGGGWPIFHEAWENLRDRRMTMELDDDRPRRSARHRRVLHGTRDHGVCARG